MSDEKLSLTNALLQNVHGFQPTGGQRVHCGPYLNSEEHKDLVREKYELGQTIDDHITLFRKHNKKALGQSEIDAHVVPGPWTPPSSLGFVLGGLNQRLRIWLGTRPSSQTFINDLMRPAILARELALVIRCGWIARAPYPDECFKESFTQPITVFTPPGSPKVNVSAMQRLMDVESDDLTMTEDALVRSSLPPEVAQDSYFEDAQEPNLEDAQEPYFQGSGWFLNGVEAAVGSWEEDEARGLAYDYDHAFCSEYGDGYDSGCCSIENPCNDPHGWDGF